MSKQRQLSSIARLSQDVFDAALSDEGNNSLCHDRLATTELHDLETEHVLQLVLASKDAIRRLQAGMISIRESAPLDKDTPLFADIAVIYIEAIRIGWHARGAVENCEPMERLCAVRP